MITGGIEFVIGIMMMFGGGFGIPLGMPPADEIPMMSNIAPSECLFFATWAGAAPINADGNPTEKWMAQPELQRSFEKIKTEVKRMIMLENESNGDEAQKAGAEFIIEFVETMLTHSGTVFVTKFDVRDDELFVEGGMLLELGDAAKNIETKYRALMAASTKDSKLETKTIEIEGIAFEIAANEGTNSDMLWAFHDGYFWAALSEESMRNMLANSKTESPAWLKEIRRRLPIERVASVSYINAEGLIPLLDLIDERDVTQLIELVGIKDLKSLAWVGGLNEHGYATRTFIDFNGEPNGIFGIVSGEPIKPTDLGRVDKDAMLMMSQRINPERLYDFIFNVADATGGREELENQVEQFKKMTDVDFKDDLIDSLDDLITVYGSLNLLNPTSGWVLSVKIKNEMIFQGAFSKLNEFARNMSEAGQFEFKEQTRNGKVIYSLSGVEDFFMPVEPSWCQDNGELVFSLNRSAVSKHTRREGIDEQNNIAAQLPMKLLFNESSAERQGPLAVMQFDFAEVVTLAVSAARGFLPDDEPIFPDSDFYATDIPTAEVLTNGIQPNVYSVYRTETGFEMFQQQTFPGGSAGVTLGMGAAILLPAIESTKTASRRTAAANNLRVLAIAMHNYHDAHRALPAAFSTDKDGKPLLSWRVHILPFLEDGAALYDEFHLDEPWDSAHNIELLEKMPAVFESLSMELEPGKTASLAITGTGSMFGNPAENSEKSPIGVSLLDVKDGTSQSIMLVEANRTAVVNWTEPKDFDVDDGEFLGRLEGVFPNGNNFAFGDGSVQLIQTRDREAILKKLFTIDGGEIVDWEEIHGDR